MVTPYPFADVQGVVRLAGGGNPGIGPTPWVACAASPNGDLHLLAIDQNNGLWHTIRRADGSWPQAFKKLPGIAPTRAACAVAPNGDLHVLAIDVNNGLYHTIQRADGSWPYGFGDVQGAVRQAGGGNAGIGPTPWVACAADSNGVLHVLATDLSNRLWYTVRSADGSWPRAFGDLKAPM